MLGKPLVRFCEGLGYNSDQGCNIVAPPGNQAANREYKRHPTVWGVPSLLEGNLAMFASCERTAQAGSSPE